MQPLISIVMPVYNGERYIAAALQSLATQNFRGFELVILDSCSVDNTLSIVEEWRSRLPQLQVIREKDRGIYDAMNKGVAVAKGEWVYFMGCDDGFYDAFTLEQISKELLPNADLVYGDVVWMPQGDRESGGCVPADLVHRNINHQRIFYRKALFSKYGGYQLQYSIAADHELNIRFFCNETINKKYVSITVARYHAGGFSANKQDEVFWNNWKIIFKENFAQYLPKRVMYDKLGWYCRYQLDRRRYSSAFPLFWDVLLHTKSLGFVQLSFKHFLQSLYTRSN
ncbi:glycosyltransferase family 2 protein [Lacibacter sp.]|uniref:glycosyltransferase family 2 protein n=1 Tax=Lacibacter sp. TaxID=1915409 RepID=UPI002B4AE13F|nr:glycosyltransferase family 2 protein [Lacibacter sp.]HLP36095.1 glycosyltransferase family 2 protein [Lacibacter sp.]